MKKLVFAVFATLFCVSAFAQQGTFAVGAQAVYGSEIKNVGFGVKAQYSFTDPLRAEASFNYFLKKDGVSMWEINANAHYLFDLGGVSIYPLAGLNYSRVKVTVDIPGVGSVSGSDGKFGANLGGGVEFPLSETIALGAEVKYVLSDYDQLVAGVGVTFKF